MTAPAFTQDRSNPGQLLRNAASDAMRAAVAVEGFQTYEGMQSAEDAIRRALDALRAARPMVREAAKPIRAERSRRRTLAEPTPDPFAIPAMGVRA